ncbi:hypothetical protein EB061_08645 [bacterium]|nr:hypothetical protein [bacterium]
MRIHIRFPFLLPALLLSTLYRQTLAGPLEDTPLFLEVGEQRPVALPPLERFSVSGECVRYWRDPRRNLLLLKASKPLC